jgi:NADH:ubiquinone oxidoreductase subunit 4 (subunit M)
VVACLQVDIKKLIALSRVSHLNLVMASLVTQRRLGLVAFILMSFTHGLVSNRLFYLAGVESSSRRLMYYLKGNLAIN